MCPAVGLNLWASFLRELADLCFEMSESLGERLEKRYGFVRYSLYIWVSLMAVVPHAMEGVLTIRPGFKSSMRSPLGRWPSRFVCRLRHDVG